MFKIINKFIFVMLNILLLITAKKHENRLSAEESKSIEEDSDPIFDDSLEQHIDNLVYSSKSRIELYGTVKKYFAVEAALLDPQKSLVCSPLSALLPLGKLAFGAVGKCFKELKKAIGVASEAMIKKSMVPLIKSLQYLPGVNLSIASQIYIRQGLELKSKYKKKAKTVYNLTIDELTEDSQTSANKINDWVSHKTSGMIPEIILPDDIKRGTVMIIINAIYFSGKWEQKFTHVVEDDFHSPKGIVKVPMMTRQGKILYIHSHVFESQIVKIPYEGGNAELVIVLPSSRNGLPDLLKKMKLGPAVLDKEIGRMHLIEMRLTIPKFKITSTLDLQELYKKIGLRKIFHKRGSGLTEIVDGMEVFVSSAVQKAIIDVNEVGTEASAASAMHLFQKAGLRPLIVLRINRPFYYALLVRGQQAFVGIYTGI